MPYAGCSKDLLITFCHDSQYGICCSTTLPPQLKKCHTNEYTTEELGECADFDFASEKMIGSITFADPTDLEYIGGYQADWISLTLKDDNVLHSSPIPFIQGNYLGDNNVPDGVLSGNFECNRV